MIDVKFILINKLIFLLIILFFFISIFLLNRIFKKQLSLSNVKGTIKLCVIGLLLLFFESELINIFFYGKLVKKLQELITLICFANFVSYIVIDLIIYYKTKREVPGIIRDAIKLAIYLIFALISLKVIFNIEVSSIITTSAVLTAAIAFAMQNTLSNVISGFSVQIDKNLKKHTWLNIKEKNITGQVESVGFRYTVLKTLENEKIIVPNNILLQNIVISYGKEDDDEKCALSVNIGVGYEVPPIKAKKILLKILKNHPDIKQVPEAKVYVSNFGENYIEMRMRFYVYDFGKRDKIKDDILTQAWYSLNREGLNIPYPHREVIEKKLERPFKFDLDLVVKQLLLVDIFSLLSNDDLLNIVKGSIYKVFAPGEVIVQQDEEGDSLFFVISGSLAAYINGDAVGTIEKNHFFGEMSLLTGEKRKATVIAKEETHLLEITKTVIEPYIKRQDFLNLLVNVIAEREQKNLSLKSDNEDKLSLNVNEHKNKFISMIKNFFRI